MGRTSPEDLSGLPAGWLAQRILAEANANPALINRNSALATVVQVPAGEPATARLAPFSTMALLSDPALDVRQYLEDLVSIAVNSAQQAEDVSAQARDASRKARRGMVAIASFGLLGLIVGVAGFAASRSSNVKLSEVRHEVSTLQDMQRQANDQIAQIVSQTTERENAVEEARLDKIAPVEPPQPRQLLNPTPIPLPVVSQPQIHYSTPWPDSRPVAHVAPVQHARNTVVVPRFFADFQRNVRAIFR